mgnify:CR=1 FL=1
MLFAQGLLHFERGSAKLHGIKAEKDRSGGTPASRRVTLRENLSEPRRNAYEKTNFELSHGAGPVPDAAACGGIRGQQV